MPMYEFKCMSCKHRFELLCSMNQSETEVTCPECEKNEAKKVMSTFSARSGGGGDAPSQPVGGMSKCGSCAATSCGTCH